MQENKIYMDHNATTYCAPEVVEAMLPYFTEKFANPSSIYKSSQSTHNDIDNARKKCMELLGIKNGKLVFTAGGSESDNLAIKGFVRANKHKGNHIITSQIEHHAVMHTCEYLEKFGYEVSYIPVDKNGIIDLDTLRKTIKKETILISIMYANNETGVIQPLEEIIKIAHEKNIKVHTDAVQVVGKIPIDLEALKVDLLSLSAHKFYGPKGIGALYIKNGTIINPIIHGGSQELKLRAGTENVPAIIGLTTALELAITEIEQEEKREKKLRDKLESKLLETIPESFVNGIDAPRLSNTLNIIFKYVEGEGMLLNLDNNGIAASSGSACTSGSLDPSHVLLAMGIPHEHAHGSLRFSLGRKNTEKEIDYVIEKLPLIVKKLREMSPLWEG